ncbi:REB1 [Scenedesmus sp. PABB004]|nr:REB1 [Scenedesmus sp. PABB004]
MAELAKDAGRALAKLLAKEDGQLKLSKAAPKVLKRLAKKGHDGLDEERVEGLLRELLRGSSDFSFDGKKVGLRQPPGSPTATEAAPSAEATAAEGAGAAAEEAGEEAGEAAGEEQQAAAATAAAAAAAAAAGPRGQRPAAPQPISGARRQLVAAATQQAQARQLQPAGAARHTSLGAPARTLAAAAAARVAGNADIAARRRGGPDGDAADAAAAAAVSEQTGTPGRASNPSSWRADYNRTDVKHGRFTPDERAAIADAIREYATERSLPFGEGAARARAARRLPGAALRPRRAPGAAPRRQLLPPPPPVGAGECGWLTDPKSASQKKGAITAISAALPHRTRKAVWAFVRANYSLVEVTGKWTADEDARLVALYGELGPRWKEIGARLGRAEQAARGRARDLNYGKPKNSGPWTQAEVDMLQSLVASYQDAMRGQGGAPRRIAKSLLPDDGVAPRAVATLVRRRAAGAARGGSGAPSAARRLCRRARAPMPPAAAAQTLADIDWAWVSSQMGTRTSKQVSEKWTKCGLGPTMFESGAWAVGQDAELIASLTASGAEHEWQVDWDSLVQGRSAEQCKRRWRLIVQHLPADVRHDLRAAVAEAARRSQRGGGKRKKKRGAAEAADEADGAADEAADGAQGRGATSKKKRRQAQPEEEEQEQEQEQEEEEEAAEEGEGEEEEAEEEQQQQEGSEGSGGSAGEGGEQQQQQQRHTQQLQTLEGGAGRRGQARGAKALAAAAAGGKRRRRGVSTQEAADDEAAEGAAASKHLEGLALAAEHHHLGLQADGQQGKKKKRRSDRH